MLKPLDQIKSFQSDDGNYKMVADVKTAMGCHRIFYNKQKDGYAVKKHGTRKGEWNKTDPEYIERNFGIKKGAKINAN